MSESKVVSTIKDLTPDPQNANKGTERGVEMLEQSLRSYGAGRSLLIDKNGVVIAGNKTLEAAASIGLPRSLMIMRIAYRAARAGIVTGILLAIARISGETAPLLFTALNNQFFSVNMNAPMPSLPVVIFQFALSPYEEWQKLAWTGALLITVTVLALSILARSLTARKS